ncbi:SCO7613 C-terminal domain-containing membrane protein [Dactylosporangium sp. NPDC048998]|uniref:SCO7613 C-terminal domain-containing membrane protein n=1 Tax=Dactylosporangium sp. NPDC048998 TaxID=3363976 RepID=UPI003711D367
MVSYPCPFCGAPAGLDAGCSGCGRPPYPDAAEVVRLNGRTIELYAEVEAARTRYGAAVQRFNAVQSQRNMLAARVKAAVAAAGPTKPQIPGIAPDVMKFPVEGTGAAPTPGTAGTGTAQPAGTRAAQAAGTGTAQAAGTRAAQANAAATGAAPTPAAVGSPAGAVGAAATILGQRPEAGPRTVQNILFILGGMLLGSAAIVFAAVAWASFGVLGRAAILAVVTLLTLAVPPVALARRLRATAETFAALGVLLVLLDGYAARYVDLAGLAQTTSPATYAGLTFAFSAAVAGGYAALTRLRAPRLAAVAALQPVLPLLALHRGFGAVGWTLVFVCVAAIGVLLGRTVEQVAWIPAGLAVLSALPPALHALATVDGVPAAARAAGVMVLLAALVVVAGLSHERTAQAGAGVAAGIVAVAGARLAAEVFPHQRYAAFAALALLVATAAIVMPQRVRRGVRVGALVVAGGFAAPYAYFAALAAVQTAARALPAWRPQEAPLGGLLSQRLFGWQEPVALVLLAAALWLLLRHRAVPVTAAVLVAFAAPAALPSPTTALVSIVDAAVLVALVTIALTSARGAAAAIPFVAAHLALAGLATPLATLLVYAVLGGLSTVVAVRSADRRLSLPAAAVALLCLPVTAAAAFRLLRLGTAESGPLPPALVGATAGLAALTAATLLLGNRARVAGTIATATAGAGVTVAATLLSAGNGGTTWFGTYAAAALAGTWLAARGFRPPVTAPATDDAAEPPAARAPLPAGETLPATTPPATGDAAWTPPAGEEARTPPPAGNAAEPPAAGAPLPAGETPPATAAPATGDAQTPPTGDACSAVRLGHAAPAAVPVVLAVVSLVPAVAEALLRPLAWLGAVWRGAPAGVGLGPRGTEWWADTPPAFGPAAAAATLAVLAVLAVPVARRVGAAAWNLAAPPAALGLVLACVAAGAPWPVVPAVTLAAGLATALAAALRRPSPGAAFGAVTCWSGIVPGLAGCLATPAATLSALGAIVAAAVLAGLLGRTAAARVLAWPVAGVSGAWLAFAAARAADLPLRASAYWVLLAAAIALAAGRLLRGRPVPAGSAGGRGAGKAGLEGRLLDAVAHAAALVAALLTTGDAGAAAGVAGLWGVALGLRALAGGARTAYTAAAIVGELLAYELVLVAGDVSLAEAYTVPVGAVAVAAGWFAARRNPALTSWSAFGPGLLAGFAPSLALVLVTPGDPGRRLLLGVAAIGVVLAGARLRLKAPIAVGGAVLVVLVGHEIRVHWDYLPRWAPLAIGGALLVGFAVTYERRLRDLARLRATLGRMR